MSSFGKWHEEQKSKEAGGTDTSSSSSISSWFPTSETLPLWENAEIPTFSGMRASLESQLPQNVMGMNYQQRFQMFCALLFLSGLFFALGFFVGLPMVAIRPQKFALCFSFGSLTFMASFGVLKGPMAHLKGMLSADRIVFTTIYIGSMLATLYFTFHAGGASGYVLVMGASAAQLVALLWYLISFLPGGSSGLSIVLSAMATILKPVFIACAKMQAMIFGRCLSYWVTSSSS
mmetsp:Transcript_30240/g.49965  ORF Transcript_30240/g.49965 Transcript_30240/m.49965 type:complete len:233 (+) Transcript_30240:164-862(+)